MIIANTVHDLHTNIKLLKGNIWSWTISNLQTYLYKHQFSFANGPSFITQYSKVMKHKKCSKVQTFVSLIMYKKQFVLTRKETFFSHTPFFVTFTDFHFSNPQNYRENLIYIFFSKQTLSFCFIKKMLMDLANFAYLFIIHFHQQNFTCKMVKKTSL